MIGAPLLVGTLLVLYPNGIGLSTHEWVQLDLPWSMVSAGAHGLTTIH